MSEQRPLGPLSRRELLKLLPPGLASCAFISPMVYGGARELVNAPALAESDSKKWVAKWIWCQADPIPQNFYMYFRKTFTLDEVAAEATIDVTADSRYKLFINGQFVGRGPARCDQRWQYYDTHDVRGLLRRGENVVAAIVHQFGIPTGCYTLGRGGFFLQGVVRGTSGADVRIDSDDSWRLLPASAWDRESPRNGSSIMWMEIYDARKEPRGWMESEFDDSSWQQPMILGCSPVMPWENLVPRDIPFLFEEEQLPAAIVNFGELYPAPPIARVDVEKLLGHKDGQAVYLFSYINSPVAQTTNFAVRDGKGLSPGLTRVWLNGRSISSVSPFWRSGANNCVLNLQEGPNELMVKLGRDTGSWKWDLAIGPSTEGRFAPIQWYALPDDKTTAGRVWIMGPYGKSSQIEQSLVGAAGSAASPEAETVILGRAPGTAVVVPGEMIDLEFGRTKNVALTMSIEKGQPRSTPKLRNVEKLLKAGAGAAVVSTGDAGGDPYITLDFGKEIAGYVRLRLKGVAHGIVDIGYSELLVDGQVDVLREQLNFADRYVMRDGPQEWELFFWKGFRYMQLTFRNCARPVEVESVNLVFTSYPVKYRGAFECSDPLLTKIWEVGRWTLQMCMHDAYEDCPWREQGQWVGDELVGAHTNYAAFGDAALQTKALRQLAQGQNENGLIPGEYPALISVYPRREQAGPPVPTFMVQWVTIILNYLLYTGEFEVVSELYPHVKQLMVYLSQFKDSDGLLAKVPGFLFVDWVPEIMPSPSEGPGALTGMNCQYYRALVDAAELAAVVGEKNQQDDWRRQAEQLKQAINDRLWSTEQGVYAHSLIDGQLAARPAAHDSILAVYTGVAPPERVSQSLANVFDKPRPDLVQVGSPYFYFFVLRAMRAAGRHQEALDATRRVYGKMLADGATTWWEVFATNASLCHGWSSAPTGDLTQNVLGVRVTAPGFAAFRVEPQGADLAWAKGTVPTPHGDVPVSWKRANSTFELSVDVPMKSIVELSVPATSLETTRLTSEKKPRKQEFAEGRARYWVEGPGAFRVESQI